MTGDNSMLHIALQHLSPGEILVVDAGGVKDIAVWGEVLTSAALAKAIGGVVIDGATRDSAAVRQSGLPVFCAGVVPRGPHKGFGGTMDDIVSVGGTPVAPGDLIIGDDDGVVVVPSGLEVQTLDDCERRVADEQRWMEEIRNGASTTSLLGVPNATFIER
jgi:regulator of RNase E activity RraA